MTTDEINIFLQAAFTGDYCPVVEASNPSSATCRMMFHGNQIRPGGTLSGPTMMTLADTTAYALVLAAVGFKPLAVTTSLSINFMRKPVQANLVATATMMKLGKSLAVIDVAINSQGDGRLVAHAVVTYSIPLNEHIPEKDGNAFVAFKEWDDPAEDAAWNNL